MASITVEVDPILVQNGPKMGPKWVQKWVPKWVPKRGEPKKKSKKYFLALIYQKSPYVHVFEKEKIIFEKERKT